MKYISYKESNIKEEERIINNKNYIKEQLKTQEKYFDNMFKKIDPNIKLDQEQRKIILTDEDNLMVIAGAGAGKTTTITGKLNYLIEKLEIKEDEIIIITFTNKAVQELKERINKEFKHEVKITTFHKLGYEIIKENMNPSPKILKNPDEIIKKYLEQARTQSKQRKKIIQLKKYIMRYTPKTNKDIIEQIKSYCLKYIALVKSNKTENINVTKKYKKIIQILQEIYNYYETEKQKTNQIDFDDMIIKAEQIIKETSNIKIKYKYIIIDEYQDISECRFDLIKTITTKNKSKLMIVGDDWQCIYGFAASNINLFTNFKEKVQKCEILKITNTYRNSQQLINIAGDFIQKNPNQIKKHLKSAKQHINPVKIIKYKTRSNNKKTKIIKLTEILDYIIKKYGEEKNILILGRYTFDKNEIIDNETIIETRNQIKYKKYPNTKIEYMTIHSAKGLGYDNVILINTKNQKLGFPSKIKTDPILNKLIVIDKTIKYSEERRLFYVALTRTKNEIIIMTPQKRQSKFIKELKKQKNVTISSNINQNQK